MTPEKFEAFKKELPHLFTRKLVVKDLDNDITDRLTIKNESMIEDDMVDKLTKEAEENPEYFEDSDRSWADYQ